MLRQIDTACLPSNWWIKEKELMIKQKEASRCANRSGGVTLCESLQKPGNSPQEHNDCQSYPPKQDTLIAKTELASAKNDEPEKFLIGTKIDKCDICKVTKKVLLFGYGFKLCDDCITICTTILGMLPSEETPQPPKDADR